MIDPVRAGVSTCRCPHGWSLKSSSAASIVRMSKYLCLASVFGDGLSRLSDSFVKKPSLGNLPFFSASDSVAPCAGLKPSVLLVNGSLSASRRCLSAAPSSRVGLRSVASAK